MSGKGKPAIATQAPKDNPTTLEEGSENGVRRRIVQALMRDLLSKHGIPAGWIECQMLIVSSRNRGPGMYVRLVIQHWDERLMNYAFALQKELIAEIKQFEPQAVAWLHGVSWQLNVESSCPYTTVPGKSFWLAPMPTPEDSHERAEHKLEPVNKLALERLFALRDSELSAQADLGLVAAGYETTQPAPL